MSRRLPFLAMMLTLATAGPLLAEWLPEPQQSCWPLVFPNPLLRLSVFECVVSCVPELNCEIATVELQDVAPNGPSELLRCTLIPQDAVAWISTDGTSPEATPWRTSTEVCDVIAARLSSGTADTCGSQALSAHQEHHFTIWPSLEDVLAQPVTGTESEKAIDPPGIRRLFHGIDVGVAVVF
jgi:hypothetical protein